MLLVQGNEQDRSFYLSTMVTHPEERSGIWEAPIWSQAFVSEPTPFVTAGIDEIRPVICIDLPSVSRKPF
jgi:hypothetical protein